MSPPAGHDERHRGRARGYSSSSTSTDPDVSCKQASFAATGVISMKCNYETEDAQSDEVVVTNDTSFDIDDYAGCVDGAPKWGGTDVTHGSKSLSFGTGSTGTAYSLSVLCQGNDTAAVLVIDDAMKNDSGSLAAD